MSDDLLHRAVRALREDESGGAGATSPRHPWHAMDGWSGIVKDVRRARRGRRLALMAALQIGLALAGLGAWAAATGRLPVLFPAGKPAEATPATPRRVRFRRPTTEVGPAEQLGPGVAASSGQAAAASTPLLVAPPRRSRAPAARAAQVAPRIDVADVSSDPEVIYGEAHNAQFVRRDYAAALAAWDRYLALAPGPLTVEARYNRALALVRLQRRDEAAKALEPFASGYYGGYRREDARALLSLLRAPQP